MPGITQLNTAANTPPSTPADAPATPAQPEVVNTPPTPTPPPTIMPSIEELLARNRQLEDRNRQLDEEKADAVETAKALKDQVTQLQAQKALPPEMSTTTTKPTWPFSVSGTFGTDVFNVVDESEAKRMYCVKHRVDPSAVVLKVQCQKLKERNDKIIEQYVAAKADTSRIPGVNIGV